MVSSAAVPIAVAGASGLGAVLGLSSASKDRAQAKELANQANNILASINLPSIEELTMPELQELVQVGILTPAMAEAAIVEKSAYEDMILDPTGVEAQIAALNQLQDIGASGGMTDAMRARLTAAQDEMRTKLAGQRGSILDQAAQQGVPSSLMAFAAQQAAAGEDARSANLAATEAAADAELRALEALQTSGTLGGNIRSQQASEEQAKAAARDAIATFNAGNQQTVNLTNVQAQNVAQAENLATGQDISNQNVGLANERTRYNFALPQQMFENALAKGQSQAAALTGAAQTAKESANQNTALGGSLLNTAGTVLSNYYSNPYAKVSTTGKAPGKAQGGLIEMRRGGVVDGPEIVPGDDEMNDVVPALLSANEVVLPRSIADKPSVAAEFVREIQRTKNPNYRRPSTEDVRQVLEALATI